MKLDRIYEIDLDEIAISSANVRHSDPRLELDELADSIKKHGLLQPVVLLGEHGHPRYKLISGQRRYLAHKLLGKDKIRVVFAGRMNKTQAVVRSLVENLQRVELDYADTAHAITELYKDFGRDERRVSRETGLSVRKIREYVQIEAQATPKIKARIQSGRISPTDVKRALRAAQGDPDKAEEIVDLIIELKPTKHEKNRIASYGEQSKSSSAKHIMKEAMKTHVEVTIIISLSEDVRKALLKATKKLSMEPEDLASKVLSDWLNAQGFFR
jgi:ParB family chromosome partitioning protein